MQTSSNSIGMSTVETPQSGLLDLEVLESDPTPIFIVKTGAIALDFDFLFCNEALRKLRLRDTILGQDTAALLFRSWTQALGEYKPSYQFVDRIWTAELTGRRGDLKIVRAEEIVSTKSDPAMVNGAKHDVEATSRSSIYKRSREEPVVELKRDRPVLPKDIPRENLSARWESIQTMMEMTDVGVFEYDPEGKLLHANEAWYRLRYVHVYVTHEAHLTTSSSHPRDLPKHVEYSFMDLVYREDQSLVMSMWNTLSQGHPVTFEMRWKPRPGSNDPAQWVLSACVPVFDDERNLISIAGNTIDINAQKKSQAAAQAQVEALEQARLSELKFTRFAQLSPTAIYIFVPETGKYIHYRSLLRSQG